MGMRAHLWTINGLSTETGVDRRAIAKQLAGIKPDGKAGRQHAWLLKTYFAAAGSVSSYESERTRYMKVRADALEREAKVRTGELAPLATFKQHFDAMLLLARSRFLALPNRYGGHIYGKTGDRTGELVETLRGMVHKNLYDMARITRSEYAVLLGQVHRQAGATAKKPEADDEEDEVRS
jgi:hypothetical protein